MTVSDPSTIVDGAEPVHRRYFVTLAGQGVQLALSLLTATIVPRALGPAVFGNYNFLLVTSQAFRNVLEPSADQAFFTFSAQEQRSGPLTRLYALLLAGQFVLVLAIVGIMAWAGVSGWIWPQQRLDQILWVIAADWAAYLTISLRQLGDTKGVTSRPQMIATATSAVGCGILLVLFLAGDLNFLTFVIVNLFMSVICAAALTFLFFSQYYAICFAGTLHGHAGPYLRRWWAYARPLIAYEYYAPIAAYVGTVLIQRWYGPAEQGLFSLASRWPGFVVMFTAAATGIVWREVAIAMHAGNVARARDAYVRFDRVLFFVTLVICVGVAACSRPLVLLGVGPRYSAAIPVLAVMAFYPLAQTYGQLNVAVLKASERTGNFSLISFVVSVPGLMLTYVFLAPPTARIPGLGMGALGMALRTTVYSLLTVQLFEAATCRLFSLSYRTSLLHKLRAAAIVSMCGLGLWWLEQTLEAVGAPMIVALMCAGVAYALAIAALVAAWPTVTGSTRRELQLVMKRVFRSRQPVAAGVVP